MWVRAWGSHPPHIYIVRDGRGGGGGVNSDTDTDSHSCRQPREREQEGERARERERARVCGCEWMRALARVWMWVWNFIAISATYYQGIYACTYGHMHSNTNIQKNIHSIIPTANLGVRTLCQTCADRVETLIPTWLFRCRVYQAWGYGCRQVQIVNA